MAAAVLAGGASAHRSHRQAHQNLFARGHNETAETCVPGCTTIWTTITGPPGRTWSPFIDKFV